MPHPPHNETARGAHSIVRRQLGRSNLGITSVYLQGIDSGQIIDAVHARSVPMIPASASLRL